MPYEDTPKSAILGASGNLERLLNRNEAVGCLELIHQSLDCRTGRELSSLLGEVGSLIESEHSACLLGRPEAPRESDRVLIVDGTFPSQWLSLYGERQFHLVDPIVAENFRCFSLQFWSDTYRKHPPPKDFVSLAEDFGLKSGCSFGLQNGRGKGGSLFSFSGPRLKRHPRNAAILNQILPHFHRVLCGLGEEASPPPRPSLSARELEVLKWTGAGKSSWETGMILRISERTVNFHINNILRKLDSVNRPQAVAVALKMGLIELP